MTDILNKIKNMVQKPEVIQPIIIIDKTKEPAPKLKTGQGGINLIKKYEGCRLEAYPDPATNNDPWTIGYGHTGPEVKKGLKITLDQAEEYLKTDLIKFENYIHNYVTVIITQNQFDALISFTYNEGPVNLKNSTLLKKINNNEFKEGAEEFAKWNKGAGKVMDGLTKRRASEKELFLT